MVRPPSELGSLRLSRLEKERLLLALLFSLLAHLAVWGVYEGGKKTGLWEKWRAAKRPVVLAQIQKPADVPPPIVFVDVADASPDAPKEAKYYSDKNSRAANPEADKNSNVPKLTGTQKEVPKTENVPRPVKAPPAPPTPAKTEPKPQPEKPEPAQAPAPGNLEKARQPDTLHPSPKPEKPERPRTLREALAMRQQQLPGMAMEQDGGVRRQKFKSSLNARSTSFGGYDRAIIEAISGRWYGLLDQQQFALDRTGSVTINFRLNPDGSVTEARITANTVGDVLGYLCLESIQQSAPFGQWPSDMRLKFGSHREITFTFFYY